MKDAKFEILLEEKENMSKNGSDNIEFLFQQMLGRNLNHFKK